MKSPKLNLELVLHRCNSGNSIEEYIVALSNDRDKLKKYCFETYELEAGVHPNRWLDDHCTIRNSKLVIL